MGSDWEHTGIDSITADAISHVPKFVGDIWFVDATNGSDTDYDGKDPDTAFATIGTAIAAAAVGDAISIKTGTYTEDIDMNLAGLEIWGEIGCVLVGTLTISSNSCHVRDMIISPAAAVGIVLTSNRSLIERTNVVGTPTIAFNIDGYQNIINECRAVGYTQTAFDVANYNVHLYRCIAQGAGAATRGFYFSNAAADSCTVERCISMGNATAGYELITGITDVTITRCSSGSGDGRWVDADRVNVWSDFSYDSEIMKELTLDASSETKEYNLYQITGTVKISDFFAHVETVLSNNHTDCHIDLWDGSTSVVLSKATTLTLNSAPVGLALVRNAPSTVVLDYGSSAAGFLIENTSFQKQETDFIVGQLAATATYIRFVHTTSNTPSSGALHFHIFWSPLSDDGFVAMV